MLSYASHSVFIPWTKLSNLTLTNIPINNNNNDDAAPTIIFLVEILVL